MCMGDACGSGGGSQSGPSWESKDRNLINDILLAPLLSRMPKEAMQGMMSNPEFSGFLDRVYGTGPTEEEKGYLGQGMGGMSMLQPGAGGVRGQANPMLNMCGMNDEERQRKKAETESAISGRRSQALDNVYKFKTTPETNFEDMRKKYNLGNAWRPKLLG